MKLSLIQSLLSSFVFILVATAGCSQHSSQNNQVLLPSPSPPARVSNSAEVVQVQTTSVDIPVAGETAASIILSISPGYHVNANPATFPYLIATEVVQVPSPDDPIIMGAPVYPSSVKKEFAFSEQPLAVYEGDVAIKIPLRLAVHEKSYVRIKSGVHLSEPINVRVQACDDEKCFPPATLSTTLAVEVK